MLSSLLIAPPTRAPLCVIKARTQADVQVQSAFLQLQGKDVSLNPLAVQKQTVLLQCLEVDGDVVEQRARPFSWVHVDY